MSDLSWIIWFTIHWLDWFLEMLTKTFWILKCYKISINILWLFRTSDSCAWLGVRECEAANNYHLIISSLTLTYRGSDRSAALSRADQPSPVDHHNCFTEFVRGGQKDFLHRTFHDLSLPISSLMELIYVK